MAVEHSCFFSLAKDALDKNGEMWTRNAISRAYYGMYHSALRLVNDQVPSRDSNGEKLAGGIHLRFSTYLCSGEASQDLDLDDASIKRIGMKLKQQHALRVNADYKLDSKVNRITALSALKDAEDIDFLIDKLLNADDQPLSA